MFHISKDSAVRSVLELFAVDLLCLPDYSFTPDPYEVSAAGSNIYNLKKYLFLKEFELFDELTVKVTENGKVRSFVFSGMIDMSSVTYVRKLVNSFSAIYHADNMGRSNFDEIDEQQLADGFWVGRMYSDPSRFPLPVVFTMSDHCLQLMLTLDLR